MEGRFSKILFNALASVIAGAENELCLGIALFSSFAIPFNRLGLVLFDTLASEIADAEM